MCFGVVIFQFMEYLFLILLHVIANAVAVLWSAVGFVYNFGCLCANVPIDDIIGSLYYGTFVCVAWHLKYLIIQFSSFCFMELL